MTRMSIEDAVVVVVGIENPAHRQLFDVAQAGNPFEVLIQRFRDTFVSVTMPQDMQHLHAYLQELVQLQNERVFAWLPSKIFID